MDSTTWTLPDQRRREGEMLPVVSLYEALQGLTDPRRGQGKRYQMARGRNLGQSPWSA